MLYVFTNEEQCWAVLAESKADAIAKLASTANEATRSNDPKDYIDDIENGDLNVYCKVMIICDDPRKLETSLSWFFLSGKNCFVGGV